MKKRPAFNNINKKQWRSIVNVSRRACLGMVLVLSLGMVIHACKTLDMGKEGKALHGIDEVIQGVKANQPDYEWINGSLKMKVSTASKNLSGQGNLKMKKDSLIWLSISPGLGLEVMRAQITPDSLYVINRMKQTFSAAPLSKVNKYFPAREITFQNLQNLLLGQPVFCITSDYEMKSDTALIHLTQKDQVWEELLVLEQGNLKMRNLDLNKPATKQSLNLQYKDYQKSNDYWLPGQLKMKAQTPEKIELELQFKEFTFKEKDQASFNIPAGYDRTQ